MAVFCKATGAEMDRLFVSLLIQHHKAAIGMAQTEQSSGRNAQATALARSNAVSQQMEIVDLEALLQTLP